MFSVYVYMVLYILKGSSLWCLALIQLYSAVFSDSWGGIRATFNTKTASLLQSLED